jgi:hypothetical protein
MVFRGSMQMVVRGCMQMVVRRCEWSMSFEIRAKFVAVSGRMMAVSGPMSCGSYAKIRRIVAVSCL